MVSGISDDEDKRRTQGRMETGPKCLVPTRERQRELTQAPGPESLVCANESMCGSGKRVVT